jgi:hypothetical protein
MITTLSAMRPVLSLLRRKLAIMGGALLLAAGLAGCSAVRLGYDQGPTLAYWWLDGRLDFDARQAERTKALLAQWFDWHRATQLEDYAALLARAQDESAAPANAGQMCAWTTTWRERAGTAAQRLAPAVAEVAVTLTPAQIARLEGKLAEDRRKMREEELDTAPAKRQAASADRALERYERLYGRLDGAQREWVRDSVRGSPYEPQRRLDDLAWRHREVLQALRRMAAERPAPEQATAQVRATLAAVLEPPQADGGAYRARWLEHQCELATRVHNGATAAQRQHLRERLRDWETDARVLAGRGRAVGAAAAAATGGLR